MVNQPGASPPLRIHQPEAVKPPEPANVFTVTALTMKIKNGLEKAFASVWVGGEVSSLSRPGSGHLYFNLKDRDAILGSVMWRTDVLRQRYPLEEGQEIVARGRLIVYPPRGSYQFVVEEAHPKGLGAQDLALRRLKEKLKQLGYFAPERKKALPRFPRRIGLVASPTGAAVRDMLEILGRRWPCTEVWVRGVRVAGEGAPESIAQALAELNQLRCVDVVLLGRGGGSSDELAVFNAEVVAHAIYRSRIPVVAAIGHEVDVTIADLVADRRALTPSEAAVLATPARDEFITHLRGREQRLHSLLMTKHQTSKQRFLGLAQRRALQAPLDRVRELERRLDDWDERLRRGMQRRLQLARQRAEGAVARLESLSPLKVLARGYSLTRLPTGEIVRSVQQAEPGATIEVLVPDGRLQARVERVETDTMGSAAKRAES
jgi:exodeoxyribonuclease VII large subunit